MKWSLKLGSFAGIHVYLHWTFVLLLGWILFSHLRIGHDWLAAWKGVGFIIALFGCVLLHEFGHALTAKRYGIHTQDNTGDVYGKDSSGGHHQGRRVIVDDILLVRAGTTDGQVYTSYLFGPGAFAAGLAPLDGDECTVSSFGQEPRMGELC